MYAEGDSLDLTVESAQYLKDAL